MIFFNQSTPLHHLAFQFALACHMGNFSLSILFVFSLKIYENDFFDNWALISSNKATIIISALFLFSNYLVHTP
jgi:hypothetical protein